MNALRNEVVRAPRLAVLALLAPLVVAMGGRGSGSALEMRTIASGGGAGSGGAPHVWLARSAEELANAMSARVPGFALPPEPAQPAIDFSREVVVGVALGERLTGGFGVEIVSAARRGTTLEVTFRETKPEPGAMTIQVLTNPWTLAAITVDGTIDRVVAKDARGRELPTAETSTGPATR
ncbi:MAG: protease complex subunit PrcB family protein [bacterium]